MSYRHSNVGGAPDANQDDRVADYRALGCSVFQGNGIGFGFPDLIIGCSGRTELVEVKTEDGVLSESQKRFAKEWRGAKVRVVRTRDDVIEHVRWIRARVIHEAARAPGT